MAQPSLPTPPVDRERETVATVGYPSIGRPVAKEDWFLLWGPLGVMCLLAIAVAGILWRRLVLVTRDKDVEIAALNKRMSEMQEAHAEKLEDLAKEHAAQFQQMAEKGHVVVGRLSDVLDAAGKKIIRG